MYIKLKVMCCMFYKNLPIALLYRTAKFISAISVDKNILCGIVPIMEYNYLVYSPRVEILSHITLTNLTIHKLLLRDHI